MSDAKHAKAHAPGDRQLSCITKVTRQKLKSAAHADSGPPAAAPSRHTRPFAQPPFRPSRTLTTLHVLNFSLTWRTLPLRPSGPRPLPRPYQQRRRRPCVAPLPCHEVLHVALRTFRSHQNVWRCCVSLVQEDELLARALQAQFDAEWAAAGAAEPAAPVLPVPLPEYHATDADFPALGERPAGSQAVQVASRSVSGRRWGGRPARRSQQQQREHHTWTAASSGGATGGAFDGGDRAECKAPPHTVTSCDAGALIDGHGEAAVASAAPAAVVATESDDLQLALQLQAAEDRREAGAAGLASSEAVRAEVLAKFKFDEARHELAYDSDGDGDDHDDGAAGGDRYMDIGGGLYQDEAGNIVTKHDATLCGKRNSRRLETVGATTAHACSCPASLTRGSRVAPVRPVQHLETGGSGLGISSGVMIGNQAFNSLKRFLDKQQTKGCVCARRARTVAVRCVLTRHGAAIVAHPLASAFPPRHAMERRVARRGRVSKAQFATKDGVIDDRTRLLLFKLVNNGYLEKMGGVVKTGKEGHIYHASGWTYVKERGGGLCSNGHGVLPCPTHLPSPRVRRCAAPPPRRLAPGPLRLALCATRARTWRSRCTAPRSRSSKTAVTM